MDHRRGHGEGQRGAQTSARPVAVAPGPYPQRLLRRDLTEVHLLRLEGFGRVEPGQQEQVGGERLEAFGVDQRLPGDGGVRSGQ